MSPVKKNKPAARASRAPRRESPSAMPKSSTSVSPERVRFDAERSRFSTPNAARGIEETAAYLSDPMSIYSSPSPSRRGNTAPKYGRRPCGHRSVLSDRMSESPVRSGISSPSMGWSRAAHTGHSSNSTLFKRDMSLDIRRNSASEYAGSEASSSSSSGNGMDFDIDLDIDIVMSSNNPRINIQPSRAEPRRPKRGADEFDSLADMMRGLDVGRKRSRHDEQLEPKYYHAKIEFMDHQARTIKKVPVDRMPRRISSSNILAKCTNIPAHAKPVVQKDRSKLRRRQNED